MDAINEALMHADEEAAAAENKTVHYDELEAKHRNLKAQDNLEFLMVDTHNDYQVPYWENTICNMIYNQTQPSNSQFELTTNCGKTPLFMYRVGTYNQTGIG